MNPCQSHAGLSRGPPVRFTLSQRRSGIERLKCSSGRSRGNILRIDHGEFRLKHLPAFGDPEWDNQPSSGGLPIISSARALLQTDARAESDKIGCKPKQQDG